MDFNIPPINPSGINPINPPSGRSGDSNNPAQRALNDAMVELIAELEAALKTGNGADLTKLIEAGKRIVQLSMVYGAFIQKPGIDDPFIDALGNINDKNGNFSKLMEDCAFGTKGQVKDDFMQILNDKSGQKQIQDTFNAFEQSYPPVSSNYNTTEQLFLDVTALFQQVFGTKPRIPTDPDDPLLAGMIALCAVFSPLESDLKNDSDNMYNTFIAKAPPLMTQLFQDASSNPDGLPADMKAIENNWSSVNAGIQDFLNGYPLPQR